MTRQKSVLSTKSSVDIRNDKGESLLHQAVKKQDISRVKQLIDEGQTVNTIDHNSWTPLHEVRTTDTIDLRQMNWFNQSSRYSSL
jgi:ankyrin repeat protein